MRNVRKNSIQGSVRMMDLILLSFITIATLSYPLKAASAELLTLSEGLKLVTEDNRLVRITRHEERISEADTLLARSRMLPEMNASAGYTTQAHQPAAIFGPQTVFVSEKDYLSFSLNVQQTLFDFRGNASRYAASKAILSSKKLDVIRMKNLVALDFLLIYFDLLEAEKMFLVAGKEVERLEAHLRDAIHLYEEGVITKNDLLQAEVQISDAKQRLLSAENLRSLTASRLNNILSRQLTEEVRVADIDGLSHDNLIIDKVRAWEEAEKSRPEIMIVDETLKSLDFEKKAKVSEYFPQLFVRGGYDYTENEFMVHEDNWYIMLGLNMNIFQGGATRAGLNRIENQKLKLIEQRNKLLDDIKLEVERYLLDIQNSRERIMVTRDAIKQAEENLRINKLKYEEGVGTATEVIDALTLLTRSEVNYYRAVYDLRRAEGAFLYATGRNLQEVYREDSLKSNI